MHSDNVRHRVVAVECTRRLARLLASREEIFDLQQHDSGIVNDLASRVLL